jgi:hypothetical protein
VTPGSDALLLDTCAIINLSYCSPIATLFQDRYKGRGGWTEAVRTELTRQRTRKPPHPQAGRACNWAKGGSATPWPSWMNQARSPWPRSRRPSRWVSDDDSLDHLGEAASIHLLVAAGSGRLISDDHGARDIARNRGVKASSTVGVLAELLARGVVSTTTVDTYLTVLRAHRRMRVPLTPIDLLAGDLRSWA